MLRAPLALLLTLLLLPACAPPAGDADVRTSAEGVQLPYEVVCTVGMVADLARNVAGDRATVRTLMGEGIDPHLYKATRDDVAAMSRAGVVFYNGLLLEGKMQDLFVQLGRDRPVVAVTSGLDPETLLEPEGEAGHPDPHVWMDPDAWARCVDTVRETLSGFDPDGAAGYAERAAAYQAEIRALGDYGRGALATIPEDRRILITSHDAFSYFGRAFGLDVRGIQGLSTESEAGLQRMNQLVDLLVERGVEAVFVETSVPTKSVEALRNGARRRGREVAVGGTLYSDAMGAAGTYEGTYLGMIDHNVTTVARALGGDAPERGVAGRLGGGAGGAGAE